MKVLLFILVCMLGISACNKTDNNRVPQGQEEQKQYKDLSKEDVRLDRNQPLFPIASTGQAASAFSASFISSGVSG